MATAKSGAKTIGIWSIVGILAILVCPFVSLIQSQEAYAEEKKVSGTSKWLFGLPRSKITQPGKTPVVVNGGVYVLNSTDPTWNNASFCDVSIHIDWTPYVGNNYKTYAVITDPGGDQAFTLSDASWKMDKSVEGLIWSAEANGTFVGGTGKFEGIKAHWKLKLKGFGQRKIIGEWEAQYYK